jgi:hypothetical protein
MNKNARTHHHIVKKEYVTTVHTSNKYEEKIIIGQIP